MPPPECLIAALMRGSECLRAQPLACVCIDEGHDSGRRWLDRRCAGLARLDWASRLLGEPIKDDNPDQAILDDEIKSFRFLGMNGPVVVDGHSGERYAHRNRLLQ